MTVTVVYGKATDGYLTSTSATYATARGGAGVAVTGGNAVFVGQNFGAGVYQQHQGFIGFDFAPIGVDMVVTAVAVRLQVASVLTVATSRHLELRDYPWSAGGLVAADWRNVAALAAAPLLATVQGVNSASGKYVYAGSDELLTNVAGVSTLEFVMVTDRERAGTTPTTDEALSVWSADVSGTTSDPALIFTTVSRSTLFGNLGAQGQLSDGSSVALEGTGLLSPSLDLVVTDNAGSATPLGATIGIGTGGSAFAIGGLQSFAVAVGSDDSVYLVGRAGDAENSIRIVTWVSAGMGSHSWTSGGTQTVAMVAHDAAINQVAACVVTSNGLESLVVLGAHTAGTGLQTGHSGDVAYALLNTAALRGLGGTVVRAVGAAVGGLFPSDAISADFGGFVNPTGTGLDVVTDLGNPGWFYATSFRRDQDMGSNAAQDLSRGILTSTHTALSLASPESALCYGVKDASAKLRVVPCSPGVAALVTADADSGFGLSIDVRQHFGTDPGSVGLGSALLGQEEIPSMPDGPDVAGSHAWDAVYNSTDSALWIYYVDVADPGRLMRTKFSLATYQATREEVAAYAVAAGGTITGVRVARNGETGDRTRVYVAWTTSGAVLSLDSFVDSFNLPPTAPTLATRDGFDATLPAALAWTFNDPNTGDAQSARRVWIEDQDTGTLALDTGKIVSASSTYTVAGGTLVNPETYRWRVQTWDAEDLVSPWSEWGIFQTAAGGSVTVTLPATDNAPGVASDDVEVRWAVTGTVQAAYRVWLYRTSPAALVSDTGWVASVGTSRVVTGMLSDVEYRVEVQVRNAVGVVSNVGTRLITPSYGTPEPPELTVDPRPDQGYTALQVHNPLPGEPGTGFPSWDFEVGGVPAGWFRSGGTAAGSTEQAHSGTVSAKLTATGGVNMSVRAPSLAITPGQRYTVRGWAFRPVAGPVSMGLDWTTPGGAFISTTSAATTIPASTWTEVFTSGTAPVTAGRVSYGPALMGPPAAGTVVYVDDLILTVASDRPNAVSNLIMRRRAGTSDPWEILGQCPPDGELRDYTAAAKIRYEYKARGVTG